MIKVVPSEDVPGGMNCPIRCADRRSWDMVEQRGMGDVERTDGRVQE